MKLLIILRIHKYLVSYSVCTYVDLEFCKFMDVCSNIISQFMVTYLIQSTIAHISQSVEIKVKIICLALFRHLLKRTDNFIRHVKFHFINKYYYSFNSISQANSKRTNFYHLFIFILVSNVDMLVRFTSTFKPSHVWEKMQILTVLNYLANHQLSRLGLYQFHSHIGGRVIHIKCNNVCIYMHMQ